MKHVWKLAVLCLGLAVLMSCTGGDPLEGSWKGNVYGDEIELVFFNDICFIFSENYLIEYTKYTYMKKESIVRLDDEIDISIKIKGSTLTLKFDEDDDDTFDLVRAKTPKAHPAINGFWKGSDEMMLAFNYDKVFLFEDDYIEEYGTYTYENGKGSIDTQYYELEFTVKGNTLTIPDEDMTFTRTR